MLNFYNPVKTVNKDELKKKGFNTQTLSSCYCQFHEVFSIIRYIISFLSKIKFTFYLYLASANLVTPLSIKLQVLQLWLVHVVLFI